MSEADEAEELRQFVAQNLVYDAMRARIAELIAEVQRDRERNMQAEKARRERDRR